MSHLFGHAVAIPLDAGAREPYTQGMRNTETMPPGADDAAAAAFEKAIEAQGEYWARAENAARALGRRT